MEGKGIAEVSAIAQRFDYYCWDVYARVAEFYNQSEDNKQWRSLTLKAIEASGNPTAELAEHVATRIVRAHLATMKRINVGYDLLPRESDILHLHFWEKAFELLKQRGAIYFVTEGKNRGCWVMHTAEAQCDVVESAREELEEDEKIIVRSDGTVTYVGKDIAYQLWKFGLLGLDFHYRPFETDDGDRLWITSSEEVAGSEPPRFGAARRVYNVIDSRQAYLQGVVLQGLQALGFPEEAANSIHFSYEMVALTPATCEEIGIQLSEEDKQRPFVELSGRKGLGVKADDLLDALIRKELSELEVRHELEPEEAAPRARIIAVGALRYFLERFARNTLIAFDFKEALNFEGETGPYLQYSVVRADSIFRKFVLDGGKTEIATADVDATSLGRLLSSSDDIWEIVYYAARMPEVVRQVAQSQEVSHLAKYAFHLAQKFNLFYHRHRILSDSDESRKMSLLFIVDVVRKQLSKALDLLGCEVPPMM